MACVLDIQPNKSFSQGQAKMAALDGDSQATQARNLAYALHEKLAFSSLVDPASPRADEDTDEGASISFCGGSRRSTMSSSTGGQGSAQTGGGSTRRSTAQSITLQPPKGPTLDITFQAPEAKDTWAALPELHRAREALSGLLLTRLRDFQLLTGWPLQGRRRTPAQLARLLDQAEEEGSGGAPWQALGMHASPFLALPALPELVRADLWGPLDILLALAGHISHEAANSGAVQSQAQLQSTPPPPANLFMLQAPLRPPTPSDTPVLIPNVAVPSACQATGEACTAKGSAGKPGVNPFDFPSLLTNQGGASASGYGASGSSLPRSLGSIAWLPALQHVQPAGLDWLRAFLTDLRPQQRHVGVDDRLHPWFREVKVQAARALVAEGSIPLCRGFAKYGVPHGCRSGIWEVAMGLTPGEVQQAEVVEFESLIHEACCQPLLADVWAHADALLVRDSEQYFLFEETLRAVQLAFLRDTRIPSRCSTRPLPCVHIQMQQTQPQQQEQQQQQQQQQGAGTAASVKAAGAGSGPGCVFPPCGVLLPQGSVMLAGPLCFMYEEPAAVYRMHRALYCRYWCKLHSLSSVGLPSPALPVLLRTFEELMQALDPEVVGHLHRLGVPCASVALPWIARAFVGFLPVEEVLLLWDRVIGLDSLLPVTLLAAAVLCFRRQVLLSCSAAREVLEAMADLSQLQTVPLLQAVLFQG